MDHEIAMMNKYKSRIGNNGPQISQLHHQLKNITNWTPKEIPILVQYLNLIFNHQYLKKSVRSLTFVSHCLPINLCNHSYNLGNLKVFQQVELTKKMNCIESSMKDEAPVIGYLTVTSDGILKSTRNLMETKI